MNKQELREAFEAWATDENAEPFIERMPGATIDEPAAMWAAWQACAIFLRQRDGHAEFVRGAVDILDDRLLDDEDKLFDIRALCAAELAKETK